MLYQLSYTPATEKHLIAEGFPRKAAAGLAPPKANLKTAGTARAVVGHGQLQKAPPRRQLSESSPPSTGPSSDFSQSSIK